MSLQRNTILIGAAVALAAVAGFWFLVLGPKQEKATQAQAQVEAARATLVQTRGHIQELKAAKGSFTADYSSIVRLGKAVPTDDDVRSLLVQLDTTAKRSGVDFRQIQLNGGGGTTTPPPADAADAAATQATAATLPPGATVGPAGFPTMPFSFEFAGQFFTLSDFFSRLDRLVRVDDARVNVSGRLLTVDAFTLKPGKGGFPAVDASIGATAYLLPGANGGALNSLPSQGGATASAPAGSATTPPVTATSTGAIR